MARQRAVRAGHRWQPVVRGRQSRRVAGRSRWRRPRVDVMGWAVRWRRVLLPVLVLGALVVGGWWVYCSPLLALREVTVEGSDVVPPEVVRSVADLEGQRILHPDFAGARERLLALPMVKDVSISHDWPSGAHITVVERTPWGLWQVGYGLFVIDEEGMVLDQPAPEGAPVIVQTDGQPSPAPGDRVDAGALAVASRLVATAEQTLGRPVVGLEFSRASGLTVALAGAPGKPPLRAVFGDAQGYEFKVAALYAVIRQAEEQDRALVRVDLRFGDRVAVQ